MQNSFIHELRYAYNHLYEWVILRRSLLIEIFNLEERENPSQELGNLLKEAIEALKPISESNPNSRSWRLYRLLYVRYIEQLSQYEAAEDIGLSIRHLRREETLALNMVGTYLWDHFNLEGKLQQPVHPLKEPAPDLVSQNKAPDRHAELEWLQQSIPLESVKIQELIQNVLFIVNPTFRTKKIHVEYNLSENLPPAIVQRTTIRQALLGILDIASHAISEGSIEINSEIEQSRLSISFEAIGKIDLPLHSLAIKERELVIRQLVELSGGTLVFITGEKSGTQFKAVISLPVKDLVKVMVIDDNVDTLQFIERCLTGTRYLCISVKDLEKVFEIANANPPHVILLDVMLPKIDGWELLAQFKLNPVTSHIPIIVFSILSQEQIAKDLGAMAFIRKPVSRKDLLGLLDQNLNRFLKEPN